MTAFGVDGVSDDPFEVALRVVRDATEARVPLRLLGGQAVRVVCPNFPPRARDDQDLDFASVSRAKTQLVDYLQTRGFEGDKRFNALHGHRQMYFKTPEGRTVDVIMDQLRMCHVLDFRDRIERMPLTLDVTDLLLSKLQVVELNQKDAQDIVYLLSGYEVREGDEPATIALERFADILGNDWGWWRTVTGNLDRVLELLAGELRTVVPGNGKHDPVEQVRVLRRYADEIPKSLRWRIRARLGERVRWYDLPEEVDHTREGRGPTVPR
jgi:hypothetical protein